jgi:hypothetical protein
MRVMTEYKILITAAFYTEKPVTCFHETGIASLDEYGLQLSEV